MTFYGIDRTKKGRVRVHRWRSSTSRAPGRAVEWASGERFAAGDFYTEREGLRLYMAPKRWKAPAGASPEQLAAAIEEVCQVSSYEIEGGAP